MPTVFDHIAIATHKVVEAPEFLVGELGGVSGYGGPSGDFSWWHWDFEGGGRIEIIEPDGPEGGFVHRHLDRRGIFLGYRVLGQRNRPAAGKPDQQSPDRNEPSPRSHGMNAPPARSRFPITNLKLVALRKTPYIGEGVTLVKAQASTRRASSLFLL